MIPIKLQCGCGQRYSFDVEPVNGGMPSSVACPVCGADGTAAANQVIAQTLAAQPVAPEVPVAPTIPAMRLRSTASSPAPSLPAAPVSSAAAPRAPVQPVEREWGPGGRGDNWKWWYYVLAGICIGGYSIWQAYDQHRARPLGELFLAVFCIAIGIWDFQRKRKSRVGG